MSEDSNIVSWSLRGAGLCEKVHIKQLVKKTIDNDCIKNLGLVVQGTRVDSTIQRIVIFSNFLKLFIYWHKPD